MYNFHTRRPQDALLFRALMIQHHDKAYNASSEPALSADESKLPSTKRRFKRVVRSYYPYKADTTTVASALIWGCIAALILVGASVGIGRAIVASSNHGFSTSKMSLKNNNPFDRIRVLPSWLSPQNQHAGDSGIGTQPRQAPLSAPSESSEEESLSLFYRPDDAMPGLGDLTPRYAAVRQQIDQILPDDDFRTARRIQELSPHEFESFPMEFGDEENNDPENANEAEAYDIHNCPLFPPKGYPYQWNLLKIVENWNPDDTTPRPTIYNGLCIFDYTQDYQKALNYRHADLPFVVINDPAVQKTAERWAHPGYMSQLLGSRKYGVEFTNNNHFMYGNPNRNRPRKKQRRTGKRVDEPRDETWYGTTKHMEMQYDDWFKHATVPKNELGPEMPRWYFRLIGCGKFRGDVCKNGDVGSEYLMDELPFFQPKEGLYLVEPDKQAGIHCRYGMQGLIAENHWDAGRNAIALLGGMRRYILASLDMCDRLALYPKGHPSARHSAVDWSNPDLEQFPEFAKARANEVVLQAGQVLYLPAAWFHYIISLETNVQCNTRSGNPPHYLAPMRKCGWGN